MTRLEEHDLKTANRKAVSRQARINLLLKLIEKHTHVTTRLAIVQEYRIQAKQLS